MNKDRGFFFTPPAKWIKKPTPGIEVAFISNKPIRNFTPNMTVAIEVIPYDMTLQTYSKIIQKKLQRFIQKSLIIEIKNTKLSGHPAQKITSIGHQNGYRLKYTTIVTIKNQEAYTITGTTLKRGDRHFDALFSKTMNSFRFIY